MIIGATGLSGLIGSRVEELTSDRFNWRAFRYEDGFDITKEEDVDRWIFELDGDVVFHLAAFTDLNAAWQQKGDVDGPCYRINVLGTRNIARACQKFQKYLIHVSTDAVFGGEKKEPYTEEDKPSSIEWYGETKYLAEQEVQTSGCGHCVVRFAYPFRARFEPKKDFVRKIIDQLSKEESFPLFTDTILTPTFIDDAALAVRAIIEKRPRGIFHVVGSISLSPFDAGHEIAREFGLDGSLIRPQTLDEYLRSGGRPYPRFAALSNEKLKQELGVSMKGFSDAFREMKQQMSSNHSNE